jgi:uncharacterized protein with FMN-binding domain
MTIQSAKRKPRAINTSIIIRPKLSRKSLFIVFIFQFIIIFILFSSCATTTKIGLPINRQLKDGVYEGSYRGGPNKASVEVTIENNNIIDILIVEHWTLKGKSAELIVPGRIIENQSTDVDAVSGATNSSIVIMNAVQRAVEKAYQN